MDVIKVHIIKTIIVESIRTHSLEVEDFRVGTPNIRLISIKDGTVGPFRQHF